MSLLEKKIDDQIEYYFGDHNLPRDKFLKEQIQLDDGWVPLETMIKFNRLSCLTTDFKVILEALSKSKTGLLEISEDKTKIRRSPSKPLPEINDQYKDEIKNRSVYVKGFPTDITLDELKEWFNDKGNVENIQMRRTLQRQFKGSVFVVFDTDDSAKKFVEQKDVKYKDSEMIVLLKEDYFKKKNEDRKHHRAEVKAKAKHEKEEKQKQAEDEEMEVVSLEEGVADGRGVEEIKENCSTKGRRRNLKVKMNVIKKRALDDVKAEEVGEPASKQMKTENGSGKQ
ncbi:Lupus La protein-like B [Acipenser ruthenus]|uniref:Lupus La protein-like B n=1 Tax=Acipenser ruthenus TaxID=7906 RepID=A0A444U1K7_ACIRT|nr:Lupus La protein-like B [Acipenser ruthenus]